MHELMRAACPARDHTTVDARVAYRFPDTAGAVLSGLQIALSAQNLFNRRPPLVPVIRTDSPLSIQRTNNCGVPPSAVEIYAIRSPVGDQRGWL